MSRYATVLTVCLGFATSVLAAPYSPQLVSSKRDDSKQLLKVDLPSPDNWFVGRRLSTNYAISGYNAHLDDHTAASWGDYMLAQCQKTPDCTSVSAFQGRNDRYEKGENHDELSGEISWYGSTYGGGSTTPGDYVRVDDYPSLGIADSQFWTVPAPKKLVRLALPADGYVDYIAGDRLFPANYVTDYSDDMSLWTPEEWNAYILAECQANTDCTSTAAYSAQGGTGDDSYANWIGVIYSGGATTKADYVEADAEFRITQGQFWSIEA